ncbi:MAG TPA: hypothetical protein VGD62_05055 [Acidobacteriaceae bacterium]
MQGSAAGAAPEPRWLERFFFVSLLCFCAYVLWLPVFPTNDGPLHIYFSSILWELASRPTIYSSYFAIRHLIQPYSLHYFALIGLEHFVSPAMAEKLCVVGVLVCEALGFRYLARRLGPHASLTSLLILPLLFSWPLGGGFLNFCFSIGVSLFAFGAWFSLPEGRSAPFPGRTFAAYVFALLVLVLSHPVPLMVLILLATGDILLRLLQGRLATGQLRLAALRWQVVALGLACMAFIAPALLADKGQAASAWKQFRIHGSLVRALVLGYRVSLFGGLSPAALLYQGAVLVILPLVLVLHWPTLRAHLRVRTSTAPERLLILALLFTLAVILFPLNMNGSAHFADRMWTVTWPLAMAALAGASLAAKSRRNLSLFGVVWIVLAAWLAVRTLTPAARRQQVISEAALPDGKRGVFVQPDGLAEPASVHARYGLFHWSAGRAFARHHDILLNSPWLGLTILPIREKQGASMVVNTMRDIDAEDPTELYDDLLHNQSARETAFRDADFLFYVNPLSPAPHPLAEAEALLPGVPLQWSCTADGFYAVCVRKP